MSKPFAFDALDWSATADHPCQSSTMQASPDSLAVADVIALIKSFAQSAQVNAEERRTDWWNDESDTLSASGGLSGKTLGLVGCDRSALMLARRAYLEFGMKVVTFGADLRATALLADVNAEHVSSIQDLLPLCDYVSLHCESYGNRRLISGPELDLMKPDAVLINTADSILIDEHALSQALMFDVIRGAGLSTRDGFAPKGGDLVHCPNLDVLPRRQTAAMQTHALRLPANRSARGTEIDALSSLA